MKTQPSPIKKANNKDPDVQLILDLQRVLRLCSLRRDGVQIRQMLTEPTIDDALADFFEPLLESLRRMHRANGTASAVLDLQRFLRRMLDVLASLRARVQDPAHSIRTIAALLEDGAHGWYAYLHTLAQVDPAVFSFFAWFRHLAMTVGAGSRDLGELFTAPPTTAGDGDEEDDAPTQDGPSQQGPLDPRTRRDINSVAEAARRKRNRQMEIACRSAAGDTEADDPIQVLGDGAGKSRTDPFFPREPRPARKTPNLDRFKRNFRHALSQALAR